MTCEFTFGHPLTVDLFSLGGSYCLLIYLVLCQVVAPPKFGQTEMCVALHLWLGSYQLLPALRRIVEVFVSFGYLWESLKELSWAGSILCTLLGGCLLRPRDYLILLGI